jgi:tetratricopeptide (TPR) repeat protein
MGKRREHLICLLLIVVIIGCLTHTSCGQENDPVNVSHPSLAKSEFNHEEILNHAQKSLDRSISILNTVATLMAVLVALLTLIAVIVGAVGFIDYSQRQKIMQQAKESADEAKEYADEAKKAAEEAKPIIDRLKKAEEEIDTFRERATHLPSLLEPFSEDQKKLLDEYGKKIEFLEACGVPLNPEDYLSRGDDFYQSNEYELALKAYDKAIELKPDYAVAWDNKGFVLAKLGRYEEALKACDKAIKLKPDFANPWYNKACAYSLKGDKENALKHLSKAIDLDAKYKEKAKSDEDFKNLWDDEDFKRIVS